MCRLPSLSILLRGSKAFLTVVTLIASAAYHVETLTAQPLVDKRGGICWRVDDNQTAVHFLQFADIFRKYGFHFSYAVNLGMNSNIPGYMNTLRALQDSGNELMDHTPNHSTLLFLASDPSQYGGLRGVDHVSGNLVCLRYQGIDTSIRYAGEGTVDILDTIAISNANGSFQAIPSLRILAVKLEGIDSPVGIGWIRNSESSDPDTIQLLTLWGEPIHVGYRARVHCDFIGPTDIEMTPEAIALLVQRTRELCDQFGIAYPTTWIQPGSPTPYVTRGQAKTVLGDQLGLTSSAVYTNSSFKCFNEYNPDGSAQYAMEWGDFDVQNRDAAEMESVIADAVAKHYVLISGDHFRDLTGGWAGYTQRVDSLLRWCYQNASQIRVRTQSQWANILYAQPADPFANVIPPLNVDLDNNGFPDGYYYQSDGYPYGTVDSTDGVAAGMGYSWSVDRAGDVCTIVGLAGLEKGWNDLGLWTRGYPGDSVELRFVFSHFPEQRFKVGADTPDWTYRKVLRSGGGYRKVFIPFDASTVDVHVSCSDYRDGPVKISGLSLHKPEVEILSVPDTLVLYAGGYQYQVKTFSINVSDTLSYSLVVAPPWLSVNRQGLIYGQVSQARADFPVVLEVEDQHGNTDVQSFTLQTKPVLIDDFEYGGMPFDHGWVKSGDSTSGFASIEFDDQRNSHVLLINSFSSSAFGMTIKGRWPTTSFSMLYQTNESLAVTVGLEDICGNSYSIVYSFGFFQSKADSTRSSVVFSVPSPKGPWSLFWRDVESDLQRTFPCPGSLSITSLTISGSGRVDDIACGGYPMSSVTGNRTVGLAAARNFSLFQNHPNPFNPSTTITYSLPSAGVVSVAVYDALGRTVRNLVVNQYKIPGEYTISWDGRTDGGSPAGSGFYICSLRARLMPEGSYLKSAIKMLLMR